MAVRATFLVTKAFVKGKLPFCEHYLITTFFHPEVAKPNTKLLPPILRPEILAAPRSRGEHLLVYQTGEGYEALSETLAKTQMECRIYGMRRHIKTEEVEGTLRYRPFSEERFVEDLATARGVLAGGGFTLMGEAVALHKPMLSVPVGHQFEQLMNARYLQYEGFGMYAKRADDGATIGRFLEKLPEYEAKLSGYEHDGNRALFASIDELLDRAAAGLL